MNKKSSLEDYAVEVIQETEKDNNYGQESLTRFDQLKKKKNKQKKPKSAVENRPAGENKIIAKQQSQQIPPGASEKKPAITRKPIIITKSFL
jgi:hypothetical protein